MVRSLCCTHASSTSSDKVDSSDSAVKQILLSMNEKQSFIIEDLDDHHVVVKADEEYRVRKALEEEVRAPQTGRKHRWILAWPEVYSGKRHKSKISRSNRKY